MKAEEIENYIKNTHPTWELKLQKSGKSIWVHIKNENNNRFEMQFTPSDGIGVSSIIENPVGFEGHDEVFSDIKEAVKYIENL